jgi:hypothetical protein
MIYGYEINEWYTPHRGSPLSTFHTMMVLSSRPPSDTRYLLSQLKVTDSTRTLWMSYLDTIWLVSKLHKITSAWNMSTSHQSIQCWPENTIYTKHTKHSKTKEKILSCKLLTRWMTLLFCIREPWLQIPVPPGTTLSFHLKEIGWNGLDWSGSG